MIDQNDPRLTDYVLGELSATEANEIEQAIQNSPELEAAVEEIRSTVGLLGDAYLGEEKLSLRDEQKVSLSKTPSAPPKRSKHRWVALAVVASMAAVLIGGVISNDYFKSSKKRSRDDVAILSTDNDWTFHTPYTEGLEGMAPMDERGISTDDFDAIVENIKQTVDPESWSDDGAPNGEIQSFPSDLSLIVKNEQTVIDGGRNASPEEFLDRAFTDSMRGPLADSAAPLRGNSILESDYLLVETFGSHDRRPIELAQQQGQEGGQQGDGRGMRMGMGMGMGGKEMMGMGGMPGQGQNQQQGEEEASSELVGGEGFSTSALLRGKGIIGGGSAAGKMDEGRVLNGREMREVIEIALAETKNLTTETFEKQKIQLSTEETKQLVQLAMEEQELLARYGDRHPKLLQTRKALKNLKSNLANKNAKVEAKPKSWKRVKAIPNTTRLMVGDKEELSLTGMQVNAQVDGFRARVLVDYFYYNDTERQLEGNFKLRLPDDASLYYFAFGESAYEYSPKGKLAAEEFLQEGTQFVSLRADGVKRARKGQWDNVKEARMVPKEKAAHAFRETVRRRVDPALVEWSGAGVFSAKVFPLAPKKLHRIVVGYDVNLKRSKDGLNFELSLPEHTGECRIELNVQDIEGVAYSVKPEADPIPTEIDGQMQKRFVYETGGAQDFSNIQLSVTVTDDALLRSANDEGEFWTFRATPELPIEEGTSNSRAIFMVDTSLSSSPDKFNVWLQLVESTLTNNRDSLKEFDVLFFNVDSQFWKGKYVANTDENVAELKRTMENLALEGATDLYGAVEAVSEAKWTGDTNNRPDLFLLSDGAATWGETDLRLINRMLEQPQFGSLFAYQTGLTGTAISGLRFLAGQSGGAVFSVASEDEIKTASTAHRKRPWQLKSIDAAGARDILTAGRVQWVYPGQTITVVGRGNVDENIKLEFQQANETKTVTLTPTTIESELASRMYGQVSVGQLESLGSQVFDVSAAYARHFRVTGKTCSLLMLESEADYERFDIKPKEDLFVVKAKSTSKLVSETLSKFAEQLADPKAKLQTWLSRLESMPGMQFKIPTALKLAMDDIEIEAISQPLNCTLTKKSDLSESYLKTIANENLDYDPISAEANRRASSSVDDAIKVYSSLVERNPSDIIVARDIAFTAMEMERPAPAFHLLRRVARARPFQGNIYPAIGQCLTQMGKADMAIVYYEIAMNGTFQRQGEDFKQIVAAEYIHLLRQIVSGKLKSSVKDFAAARLETLGKHLPFGTADVVVTMMWNQDQTDVDMHVVEPSGEECYYKHKKTRSGGQITSDITTGFGPEMYYNANAPRGKYQLKAKFFGSGQNRTSTRNKVYVTIIRGFGTDSETIDRQTIQLSNVGEVEPVMTLGIE